MEFLSGWQVTPDTLIMVWLAWQLTKVIHSHDKRITALEGKESNGNQKRRLES